MTAHATLPVTLKADDDAGNETALNSTPEGHLEVAIHGPRLPFGSIHAEGLHPVFQSDPIYGINAQQVIATTGLAVGVGSGSGSVTSENGMFKVATGATQYSFASLQSRRRLRYRPGQGTVARFTALFPKSTVASCIQVAGIGTAEAGYYFGYNGTSFGILHSTGATREVQTMTITTASTATDDYVVTLPNTATVNVTATNNGDLTQTAYEIAQGTFPGWSAQAQGDTVVFLSGSAGAKSGTFSLAQTGAGTPAVASVAETVSGAAATTEDWIYQADWNGDTMDGSGDANNPSGIALNPANGNVYQIQMQYLGFGAVEFKVIAGLSGNNPEWVTVHTLRHPNSRSSSDGPHLSQPSMPFTMAVNSAGSTEDVPVQSGSFAGFTEGESVNIGPRLCYFNTAQKSSSTSAYVPLFTVQNNIVQNGIANQAVVNLQSVGGSAKGSANAHTEFMLIRDAALTGPANFTQFDSASSTYWDIAATGCTFANNSQVIGVYSVSESGHFNFNLIDSGITLQPGESITLAVRGIQNTANCVGSLNTREDQ